MAINLVSFKQDSDKKCTVHAKTNNMEIMRGSKTDEIIEELFKYLLQRYQEGLEESLGGSNFMFDIADALYYNLSKINLNVGGYKIIPIRYIRLVLLFISINFPSHIKYRKKFKSNNKSIALNILYVPYNTKEIRHAYKSKCNLNRENQIILLIITDDKKMVLSCCKKKCFALLKRITSNHKGELYYLNCFHSFRTEKKA